MKPSDQLTIYDMLGQKPGDQDEGRYPPWVEIPGVRDWSKPELVEEPAVPADLVRDRVTYERSVREKS